VSLPRSGQPGLYHLRRPDKEAGTHPGLFTPTKQHILEPSGEIRKLDKDIVTIKLEFANNAIQSYKERSTAGQKVNQTPCTQLWPYLLVLTLRLL
jgi:hypothetical protein